MKFAEKAVIMNEDEMMRAIKRMAHEILEANGVDTEKVAELVRTIQKTNLRKTSLSKLVIQS